MTKEEIEKLKEVIKYEWKMANVANEPTCNKGFEAAIKLIEYYENQLAHYMRVAAVYEDLIVISSKIKAEANKK